MSTNIIIFLVFVSLLIFVVQGAIGMYIISEKGGNGWLGFCIGGFASVIGIIALAMLKQTDSVIVDEMYERKLINLQKYKDTKEFTLKK